MNKPVKSVETLARLPLRFKNPHREIDQIQRELPMGACCSSPPDAELIALSNPVALFSLGSDSLHYIRLVLPVGFSLKPGQQLSVHVATLDGALQVVHMHRDHDDVSRFQKQWNTQSDPSLVTSVEFAVDDIDADLPASQSSPTPHTPRTPRTPRSARPKHHTTLSSSNPLSQQTRRQQSLIDLRDMEAPIIAGRVVIFRISRSECGLLDKSTATTQATEMKSTVQLSQQTEAPAESKTDVSAAPVHTKWSTNQITYLSEPVSFYIALRTSKNSPHSSVQCQTYVHDMNQGTVLSADELARLQQQKDHEKLRVSVAEAQRKAREDVEREQSEVSEKARIDAQLKLQQQLQKEREAVELKRLADELQEKQQQQQATQLARSMRNQMRPKTQMDQLVASKILSLLDVAAQAHAAAAEAAQCSFSPVNQLTNFSSQNAFDLSKIAEQPLQFLAQQREQQHEEEEKLKEYHRVMWEQYQQQQQLQLGTDVEFDSIDDQSEQLEQPVSLYTSNPQSLQFLQSPLSQTNSALPSSVYFPHAIVSPARAPKHLPPIKLRG